MDANGRPTDAHELNQQLADTIGASVEQLLGITNGIEANNSMIDSALRSGEIPAGGGQPAASGGSTQEQSANAGLPGTAGGAPSTVQTPQTPDAAQEGDIDWESTKAANGLYLGKYKTKTEAVRGVAHTVAMAKSAFTQRDETLGRLNAMQSELEALRRQPVVTPTTVSQDHPNPSPSRGAATEASPNIDKVLSKVQENGTLDAEDLQSLVRAISEHATETARKVVREEEESRTAAQNAVATRWGKVEAYMAEKYPESLDFTDELQLFIKSRPMIAAGVQALIAQDRCEEATEEAWKLFARETQIKPSFKPAPATAENVEKEIRLDAADQVRREAVEQARRDAGIVGASGGAHGVHENPNAGATNDEYDEAVARMRQGDGAQWRKLTFGAELNHPIFGD